MNIHQNTGQKLSPFALLMLLGAAVPSLATLFLPGLSGNWSYRPSEVPLHAWLGAWLPGAGLLLLALGLLGLTVQRRLPWWGAGVAGLLAWSAWPLLVPAPGGCAAFPLLAMCGLSALAWGHRPRSAGLSFWPASALWLWGVAQAGPLWLFAGMMAYLMLPDAPADTPLILVWLPALLPWAALAWLVGRGGAAERGGREGSPGLPSALTVR